MIDHLRNHKEPSHQELVELLAEMHDCARARLLDQVSLAMNPRNVPDLHVVTIICLLRGSFAFRSLVPTWDDFRDAAHNSLLENGENVEQIMRGLLPSHPPSNR